MVCIPVEVGGVLVRLDDGQPVRLLFDPQQRRVWRYCCPACPEGQQAAAHRALIRAELQQLADGWLDRVWTRCGVPVDFQGFRLETSPLATANPDLLARLQELEDGWWYFWGEYSRGKTGLAVGYAWAWLQRERRDLRFVVTPALLDEIRATYGRDREDGQPAEAEVVAYYSNVPLLVLDDFGMERSTDWANEKLATILGYRHAHGLTTIFTSNYSLGQLVERLGDQGERIAWRIRERCGKGARVVHIEGENLRL